MPPAWAAHSPSTPQRQRGDVRARRTREVTSTTLMRRRRRRRRCSVQTCTMSPYSTQQEDVMTVKTVGEMVHGHTFNAMAHEWDDQTPCGTMIGTNDDSAQC